MASEAPKPVDRSDFTQRLNSSLKIDPARTAVVTIDCHRGHLDPRVATLPVTPQAARTVVGNTKRLCDFARRNRIHVIHVILQWRLLSPDGIESLCNPFWRAVDAANEYLTPNRDGSLKDHNVTGSLQTELMPELGPMPGDIVIATKRRLSIFYGTDLEITLSELGIDTLLFAGINTNTCVLAAAFEAHHRDKTVVLVSDCTHSMYGDDLHHFGLQNVARCLGWTLPIEEVVQKLGGQRKLAASQTVDQSSGEPSPARRANPSLNINGEL